MQKAHQLLLDFGDEHGGELLGEVLHAVEVGVAVAEHRVRREERKLVLPANKTIRNKRYVLDTINTFLLRNVDEREKSCTELYDLNT